MASTMHLIPYFYILTQAEQIIQHLIVTARSKIGYCMGDSIIL